MYLTISEYAKKVGKDEGTVRRAILNGKIEAVKTHGNRGYRKYIDSDTPWYTDSTKARSRSPYGMKNRKENPLRYTWSGMKQRCYNPNIRAYKTYGARGIKVCDEWLHDYPRFAEWASNNGWKQGLTIDRIDPDGNYCPENCRFITRSENSKRAIAHTREKRRIRRAEKKKAVISQLLSEQWFVIDHIRFKAKKVKIPYRFKKVLPFLYIGCTKSLFDEYPRFSEVIKHEQFTRHIDTPSVEYIEYYAKTMSMI